MGEGENNSRKKRNRTIIAVNSSGEEPVSKKKPRAIKGRVLRVLLYTFGGLLILLGGLATYGFSLYSEVHSPQRILLDEVIFEDHYKVDTAFSDRIINIAMLGFDRGWSRERMGEELFRPDMLAVFSINFETEEVSVVRISRDSYVPIHGLGGGYDKINHAYSYGYYYGGGKDQHEDGIRYTLKTLSNTLGKIPFHYYVSVDMYSVIELVDAMGGIYYEVEETIYDEHWIIGRVLVPEGPQIMDGKTYLRYLQYRDEETDQDFGRIDRQMNLMRETFIYLREKGRISDIPVTYRIYKDYVETNLSYAKIAALAYFARRLDVDDLHFYTLPGSGQTKDGIWYQVLDQVKRVEIIKEVFGIETEPWPPIVLEDSPEYLEEQERKRREEEGLDRFRNRWFEDRDKEEDSMDYE